MQAGLTLWLGWLLVTALTFSLMAGIFHPYYTVALAPAIGALVGIGSLVLWQHRESLVATGILGFTTALTAALAFELLARDASWHPWLRYAVLVGRLRRAAMIVGVRHLPRRFATAVAAAALVAGLAGPAAYSVATAATPHSGSIPSAGPSSAGGFGPAVAAARRLRRHAARPAPTAPRRGPRAARPAADRAPAGQHRRPARRQYLELGADHPARDRRVVVHLGRRGDRLQQRGRATSSPRSSR